MRVMTAQQRDLLSKIKGQTVSDLLDELPTVPKRTLLYRLKQLREGGFVQVQPTQVGRIRYSHYYLTAKGHQVLHSQLRTLMSVVPSGRKTWVRSATNELRSATFQSIDVNVYEEQEIDSSIETYSDTSNNNIHIEKVAPRQKVAHGREDKPYRNPQDDVFWLQNQLTNKSVYRHEPDPEYVDRPVDYTAIWNSRPRALAESQG